jgi:hypothetical protein
MRFCVIAFSQTIAKTPAKWSACQILSVIVLLFLTFLDLIRKFHSHKPQQAQCLSVTEERYWTLFYM